MKLLLDVPVEGLAKHLEKLGHEVYTVTKEKVIPDEDMLKYAQDHNCILVIEDKKATRKAEEMGIKFVKVDMQMIAEKVHAELINNH